MRKNKKKLKIKISGLWACLFSFVNNFITMSYPLASEGTCQAVYFFAALQQACTENHPLGLVWCFPHSGGILKA